MLHRRLGNEKSEIIKLKDKEGNITFYREEIKIIKEFYLELYKSRFEEIVEGLTSTKDIVNQGSEILPDINLGEVRLALKKMKNNKAPGGDNIAAYAIKIGRIL